MPSAEHVASTIKLTGEFVQVNDERYLHVTAFHADLDMDNMRVYASGIFPEPELSECNCGDGLEAKMQRLIGFAFVWQTNWRWSSSTRTGRPSIA